ncbi:hypothetical protein QUA54_22770 [Microcoleus sp. MOSTC5]
MKEEGRRKKEEGRSVRNLMDVTDRRKNYELLITHYPLPITQLN